MESLVLQKVFQKENDMNISAYQHYALLFLCFFLISGCALSSKSSRFYIMSSLHSEKPGKQDSPLKEEAAIGMHFQTIWIVPR